MSGTGIVAARIDDPGGRAVRHFRESNYILCDSVSQYPEEEGPATRENTSPSQGTDNIGLSRIKKKREPSLPPAAHRSAPDETRDRLDEIGSSRGSNSVRYLNAHRSVFVSGCCLGF